ncbi:MAG: tetratricopeptide repeat protein [Cyanobacteriota bacterium]|nr:tetratricopeptide repeat protein [Cyanobacteriota bacterium]
MNNEKFSNNPKKSKFSITLGQLMTLPIILVPIIFFITDYIQLRFTGFHFWESNLRQCNKELTGDINQAERIYKSCGKIIDSTKNVPELNLASKNAGRAKLVIWDKSSKNKNTDRYIEDIKNYFSKAKAINEKDPQAQFYSAYMEDFEDFVQTPENLDCLPASKRYQEAIKLYREGDNIESVGKDFFAVLELGHFLVARDANQTFDLGNEFWDNRNGYQKAVELYKKLQVSDKDANYIVLLDKGKAYFLNQEYSLARDSWEKALEKEPQDYQIKYYIGNSWALEGEYEEAIKKYDEVTEDQNTGEYYEALRDSGFAHYIINNYETAQNRFERAIKILGNRNKTSQLDIELMEKYLKKIRDGQCDQGSFIETICYQEDKTRKLIKNDIKIKDIFTSIYTVHRKDKPTDPFLEVEHDSFYKCRIKPEF